MKKTIVVICNGPSVADIDLNILKNFDTFGLNLAYRYYWKNNWYPTYHASFDYHNNRFHKNDFIKLINQDNSIKRFFYIDDFSSYDKTNRFTHIKLDDTKKGWNNSESSFDKFFSFGNSGTNACSAAVAMGYNNIILLGADCSQKEFYDGCEQHGNMRIMTKTPDTNPNYWFNYYFQKGDIFNAPQKDIFHTPWWKIFAESAKKHNIRVVNCSSASTLTCFEKSNILDELENAR